MQGKDKKFLSIIIPFFNEEENLQPLYKELKTQLDKLGKSYEIIFVNDGSLDKGPEIISEIAKKDKNVLFVSLNRQMGKGEALSKGVSASSGEIIIFMDADLQDDPADIKRFLDKLRDGYDLVNGVRKVRKDNFVIKIYSKVFNWFLKQFLHSPFTDINCGFKAFRREVVSEIPLYSNNFRFLPLAAYYKGYKVSEVEVNNRPRFKGKSKFGAKKIFIGILDTLTAFFLFKFAQRPLHFFGSIGMVLFGLGFIILSYLSIERLFFGELLYRRPLLQFGILLIVVGVQIVMTGFLGELIVYLRKEKGIKGKD